MKKMATIAVTSILLLTAVFVVPSTGAKNISIINKQYNRNSKTAILGDEDVPPEYMNQFNGLLESIVSDDGESFKEQLIDLYVGIDDFEGAYVDLGQLYGSLFVHKLNVILGIDDPVDTYDAESNAMEKINEIKNSFLSANGESDYINNLEDAKEMDITFEDFPENFDAETYAYQVEQTINQNKAMKDLSDFVFNKINDEDEDDPLDTLRLILWALWLVVYTGFSFLPGFNIVVGVVGMIASILVGAALALVLDEVQVTDGIADMIRSLFPEYDPMSGLDYEGAISFIVGGIVFTAYLVGFTATRVVKFLTGAAVGIAGLVAIYVLIDELKKKRDQSKPLKLINFGMLLNKNILSRFFEKLATLRTVFATV